MRVLGAVLAALCTIAAGLFVLAFVVCPLAIGAESIAVAVVGAAVGLPFVFYLGYRTAKAVLAGGGGQ